MKTTRIFFTILLCTPFTSRCGTIESDFDLPPGVTCDEAGNCLFETYTVPVRNGEDCSDIQRWVSEEMNRWREGHALQVSIDESLCAKGQWFTYGKLTFVPFTIRAVQE